LVDLIQFSIDVVKSFFLIGLEPVAWFP